MKGKFPVKAIASHNGLQATKRAYELLRKGSDTLDAAVAGVTLVENDPDDTSVGYGGLPNEEGVVELDAAVMHGPTHRAGAVASLQRIKNAAQVARLVMQRSDHVLLVGEGEACPAVVWSEEVGELVSCCVLSSSPHAASAMRRRASQMIIPEDKTTEAIPCLSTRVVPRPKRTSEEAIGH